MQASLDITDTRVRVADLRADRLAEAAGVLARSFRDGSNFVDLFPDGRTRDRALPRLFTCLLRDALGHGRVDAAFRGGEVVGVAAWLPPGGYPLTPRRQLRAAPDMARVLVAAPRSLRRTLQFAAGSAALHPGRPFRYLAAVGVSPGAQGLGVGTRLLAPALDGADAAGRPCYLETHTERNVAWYAGLGFAVVHAAVAFTPGGPPNWTMWREPRRPEGTR